MIINDRVYGKVEMTEPVLLELIRTKPIQRLKSINQAGASQYAIAGKDVSRYEHSVGVMLLLKLLKASIEEQIAGLLHDIPHTAFSHVIDFVFENKKHEFHEQFHEKIIMNSEIPKILEKHSFNTEHILDEKNFHILERNLPDLCADRVDYTLRDYAAHHKDMLTSKEIIKNLINALIVKDDEIMLKDQASALLFGDTYIKMDERYWSHPLEVALFQILADAIKIALKENVLKEDDLFEDDKFVYNRLKVSKNKEILEKLKQLSPKLKIEDNPESFDFFCKNKLRYVDPKFIDKNNKITKLSDVDDNFKDKLQRHKVLIEKGNHVKMMDY